MRLFIQPCGDGDPLSHFRDTIQTGVRIESLRDTLDSETYSSLLEASGDGQVRLWGVVSGHRDRQKNIYARMAPGDLLLFTRNGSIFALGEVGIPFESRAAAEFLWKNDPDGHTWENMFSIRRITYHPIDGLEFKRTVGYRENYVFRGFSEVDVVKATKFLSTNTVSQFFNGTLSDLGSPNFDQKPKQGPSRSPSSPPELGETFKDRKAIWRSFGGQYVPGITRFREDRTLNVFSDEEGPYPDFIDPETGVIEYCGQGLKGDQTLSRGNKLLEEARKSRSPVRYWHRPKNGAWEFRTWAIVEDRTTIVRDDVDGEKATQLLWFLIPIPGPDSANWPKNLVAPQPLDLPPIDKEVPTDPQRLLDEYRTRSISLNQESAEETIDLRPRRKFKRRREARELVLARANGLCESRRCTGMPFDFDRSGRHILEVDHIIDLALGGPDTPLNMIALCPNCHKAKTFGKNSLRTVKEFQEIVKLRDAAFQ